MLLYPVEVVAVTDYLQTCFLGEEAGVNLGCCAVWLGNCFQTLRKLITLKIKAVYVSKLLAAITQPHGAPMQKTQFLSSHAVDTLKSPSSYCFRLFSAFILLRWYLTDFFMKL
jgi:hypothetical protein